MLSEGFEDAHYFLGSTQNKQADKSNFKSLLQERLGTTEDPDHQTDIPTRILQFIAAPLYGLAALWDYMASQFNHSDKEHPKVLNLTQAWNKQWGIADEETVTLPKDVNPSSEWQSEHTIFLIEKYQSKHFNGIVLNSGLAHKKQEELNQLKSSIQNADAISDTLTNKLAAAKESSILNRHRLFSLGNDETASQTFIAELPQRIGLI